VIAPSFGDIFRSNCFQNGLLPVQLPKDQAQQLLVWLVQQHREGRPQAIEVDLQQLSIRWPGGADLAFVLEPRRRHALMEGLDAIGQTLSQAAQIDAWQARDRQQRPWIWQLPGPQA
jgi:3-isopropylmalate/(R)-2-methylmalate dehydratase small subunit